MTHRRYARPVRAAFARTLPLLFAATLVAALAASCGGKREIPPEETGTPNVLPREQILYREAQETFGRWLREFSQPGTAGSQYDMLTAQSRRALAAQGVGTREQFARWFQDQRANGRAPFFYTFTRVDVLDIDVRDTTQALVTASFVVDVPSQKVESVGSFTLVREGGSWRVPFAESADFARSWWQQDRKFSSLIREEGLSRFASVSLGVELLYPVTWDVEDKQRFRVPGESAPQTGIVLSYLNPATNQKEAFVRIWAGPPAADAVPDTGAAALRLLRREDAQLAEAAHFSGTLVHFTDTRTGRSIHAFGAVDDAAGPFSRFAAIITRIIESISLPS